MKQPRNSKGQFVKTEKPKTETKTKVELFKDNGFDLEFLGTMSSNQAKQIQKDEGGSFITQLV